MFRDRRALVNASEAPWLVLGQPPSALTSGGPDEASVSGEPPPRDLDFLRGLSLPDIPIRWDDQVVRYLEFYKDDARGRNIMGAWLARERRFGPMVRQRLRALGLPADLSYLAMTESGFDPTAESHAAAVGMWQFVRATGEEYGLEVNHWVDERRDPEQSTDAGARYLRDLYRRFGSWELAFAAYNMGYGALLRAMRKYNTNDYWVLTRLEAGLPFETTFYVAKVMACAIVGRNPERFGFVDIAGEPLAFDRVDVPGGSTLPQIARAAGATTEAVAELNPSLGRNRVPPGEERSVRIPAGSAERFALAWSRTRPQNPAHRPYVVRFGETLASIAQRFRTTEGALRTLNELDDDQPTGPGFRLMVPAVAPRESDTGGRPVVAVPENLAPPPGRTRVFYRTTGGETANEVASFFRVTVDDLQRWNHVDVRAPLTQGLVLQLFVPADVDLQRARILDDDDVRVMVVGSDEFFDHHETSQGRVRFHYTLREGDTLTAIAGRFELSVGSLCRINRFSRDTTLRAGETILVYTARERAPAEAVRAADAREATRRAAWGEAPLPRSEGAHAEGQAAPAEEDQGAAAEADEGASAESDDARDAAAVEPTPST
jgi:membrane-bound lytic murein transglycosylase D